MTRLLTLLALAVPAVGQVLVDTIGYTSRDRQVYGPAIRYIANDTAWNTHAVWKDGYGDIRYNFHPRDGNWRWENGVIVNPYSRNLGCMAVNTTTGRALIGTDFIFRGSPQISYFEDSAPGAGVFKEQTFGSGYRHNLVATNYRGWERFAAVYGDSLYYRTVMGRRLMGIVGPFPGHNLAASKDVGRYGYIWTTTTRQNRGTLYFKETPNNGGAWYATVDLSDSVPSSFTRCLLGGCAIYDSIRLHLIAGFYDGTNPNRSEIWHYAKYETPPWYLVHRFSLPDSTDVGDNALAACRPSIGHVPRTQLLFAVWEQFDPENIDPLTGLARADIWACRSLDKDQPWGEPVRLTTPDQTSKRFPFLAEAVNDTLQIIYFADQVAGFWEQGQGPQTTNPVIRLRVPADLLFTAVNEKPTSARDSPGIEIRPAVSSAWFTISCATGSPLLVFDNTGRRIARIIPPAPVFDWGTELRPGVYFIRPETNLPATPAIRVLKTR